MMSCDVIRDLLPLYADGVASEASRQLIEAHTADCAECRRMLEEMCVPMEAEVAEEGVACRNIIRAQNRKNRYRMLLVCVLSVLCCLAGWLLYMETHFYEEAGVVTTTDGKKILSERPELALTEEETALAMQIRKAPAVQTALGSGNWVEIPLEVLPSVLPENTVSVGVMYGNVTVEYRSNGMHVFLEYLGGTNTEEFAAIRKTVAVPRSEEDLSAKVIYTLEYVFALEKTWYQKHVMRHVWFSFWK